MYLGVRSPVFVHQVWRSSDEIVHKLWECWIVRHGGVEDPPAGHPGPVSDVVPHVVLGQALQLLEEFPE